MKEELLTEELFTEGMKYPGISGGDACPCEDACGDSLCCRIALGLGSNCGDSVFIIERAIARLHFVLTGLKSAPLYRAKPLGVTDQADFINTVVTGGYAGTPRALLETVHQIEADFARNRAQERRWGERTLDIDILLFGSRQVRDPPHLEIPHPRVNERAFVLVPLTALLPDAADPLTGKLFRDILQTLPDQGVTKL